LGGFVGGAGVDGDAGGLEGADDVRVDDGDVDHLNGWGAEGAGGADVVGQLLAGVQQNEGHARGELAHGVEGAVVEALEDHLRGDTVLHELLMEGGGEPGGIDGGVDFGFDHETGLAFPG